MTPYGPAEKTCYRTNDQAENACEDSVVLIDHAIYSESDNQSYREKKQY